ncbi:hypothetical protein T484DRAFT_1861862 [Baffinella frigidus]|nr:hypothetical protein T484DRAFT_1861862 [Cryptophyta sp. CCMP2293]
MSTCAKAVAPSRLSSVFFTLGFIEVTTNSAGLTPGTMFTSGRAPGDIGFDPLNLSMDDSALRRFELAELKGA